jgi:hypothetical protein
MTNQQHVARMVAYGYGLPGIPVSMRLTRDLPQPGLGTGHWARRATALMRTVARAQRAIDAAPSGGVRDELDRVGRLLDRRLARYKKIAEIGQALQPDDDTTADDGTHPGVKPWLRGAALEIDARLVEAIEHFSTLATAAERLANGLSDRTALDAELARLDDGTD